MKKTLLLSILCLSCVAMTAWSRILNTESENEIAVVGYFCKNDTMTYIQTYNKYSVQENDTTVSESYEEEFMIVVTDSTSDGYKMKYIPLSFTHHDADTGTSTMDNPMRQLKHSVVCEFTTDEYGSIKSITNWREIYNQLKKHVKVMCDTLFSTLPDLDSMARKSLENRILFCFSTEEDIRDSYVELEILFGLHGSLYEICDEEEDTEEQGYPKHTLVRIGYTPIENEDYDHDGDYELLTQLTTTIPVEDIKDSLGAIASIITSIEANDDLEVDFDQLLDSLKIAKPNGAENMITDYTSFFMNGWLKEYYYEETVDLGFYQVIETKLIKCSSSYMRI